LDEKVMHVREMLANSDISFSVDGMYTEIAWTADVLGERMRYADLVLLGGDTLSDPDLKREIADASLFEAMRPLLLAPKNSHPTLNPRKILLGWDSRLEASRAAREALELMANAEVVHITLVDPQASPQTNGEEPGGDIALYLARHGVTAVVDSLASAGRDVADVLKQHGVDISADLIVIGAYGHSRMREWIFGGVTRTMLDEATVPVLMAR
jgi:nucleotide-binding universal stress UspA family protein